MKNKGKVLLAGLAAVILAAAGVFAYTYLTAVKLPHEEETNQEVNPSVDISQNDEEATQVDLGSDGGENATVDLNAPEGDAGNAGGDVPPPGGAEAPEQNAPAEPNTSPTDMVDRDNYRLPDPPGGGVEPV